MFATAFTLYMNITWTFLKDFNSEVITWLLCNIIYLLNYLAYTNEPLGKDGLRETRINVKMGFGNIN